MTNILNSSYEDFINEISGKISESFIANSKLILGLAYKGFSVADLFAKLQGIWASKSDSEEIIAKDLILLISLYHSRGPNIKNLSEKNTKDATSLRDIQTLITKYDIINQTLIPSFLEYLAATYLGIVQSLVGLFQNSKTIRTLCTKKISRRINDLIVKSEIQTIESLINISKTTQTGTMWTCSSTKADYLRLVSWGEKVYGATVPHPIELLGHSIRQGPPCTSCVDPPPSSYYISTLVPKGLSNYRSIRGPYKAYLGSKTSETTSIIQQWERETKIPLIKRATKLRSAIEWFIKPGSKLSLGILQNLEALTGEQWEVKLEGAKRTGSALHRFSCSRQSSAGYAAQSPTKLTWMCTTSDTLSTLNSINHDFMHQSLLIFAQATISEIMDGQPEQGYFHHHISCLSCLREIEEINIDTSRTFRHADVSDIIAFWKPDNVPWSEERSVRNIKEGNWGLVKAPEQSFCLGRACGFLYGDLKMSGDSRYDDASIFPLSLQQKVIPRQFMEGVLEGLIRASSIHCVSRRSISELKRPREALLGVGLHLINEVSKQPGLMTIWRSEGFENLFLSMAYSVPPSYPVSDLDLGVLGKTFLRHLNLIKYTRSDVGDHWDELPLIKCFDVADMLDPSIIYADKSHSMNRSGVINHIRTDPNSPIPTKKVLETLLQRRETNWKEFLSQVDLNGLWKDSLTIGLKGKEREIKPDGRFFSLMSWELREYFVVTEYLIKTHFVPLFKGLTMADDLNTVTKKLMDNSSGQGNVDYENICLANHVDYTKWYNHQRDDANKSVFEVMDRFMGFTSLISKTHEFFSNSLIYYNNRPDLMKVVDNKVENKGNEIVCWEGQQGGLEGLRQKRWSVVNLLVIRRESFNRNTRVTLLAQGDNQVICTKFKLQKTRTDLELDDAIKGIIRENNNIMTAIEQGTTKLGRIINKDETLQSADYLVYGKVPIFRGSIRGLETKRWSRVTCVTNDQLPTLANIMSSISSNALTVAHFATSPINAMTHYNFLGNFARNLLDLHNPAVKSHLNIKVKFPILLQSAQYKILVLYLDPCLGGACGISLTRFLIRGFADPVTESLSFWKSVYNQGDDRIKTLAINVGHPPIASVSTETFRKLLEDPSGLNIQGSVNPNSMIKEEIKMDLMESSGRIKNRVMRSALQYMRHNEEIILS